MITRGRRALAVGIVLFAWSAPASAERYAGMKYLGGLRGVGKAKGTLSVEGGELRFEDRRGRVVFSVPLASASAWVIVEKKATVGSSLLTLAALPVLAPVSMGQLDVAEVSQRTRSTLLIRVTHDGEGATLRFDAPGKLERPIAQAVNQAADEAARNAASPAE